MHTAQNPIVPSATVRSAFFALAMAFTSLTLAGIDALASHSTQDNTHLMATAAQHPRA